MNRTEGFRLYKFSCVHIDKMQIKLDEKTNKIE